MADPKRLREEIRREHEAIRALVTQLPGETETSAIEGELRELAGLLERHFEREEGPEGLHESIGDRALNLLPQVEALSSQHQQIAKNLQSLLEQCTEHANMAETIRMGARELVDQLEQHEAAENDLLGRAFYDTLGAGD